MRTFILSLILGFLTVSIYGQITYHPFPMDSTEWVMENIEYQTPPWSSQYRYRQCLEGDTIINGKQYALLKSGSLSATSTVVGAIREDSTKKVWFYNFGNLSYCSNNSFDSVLQVGAETLLFDFNLQVGEGYKHKGMQVLDGNGVTLIDSAYSEVMDIDSIQLLDGTFRRALHIKTTMAAYYNLQDTVESGTYWVEGIGGLGRFNLDVLGQNLGGSIYGYGKSHNGLFGTYTLSVPGSSPPSCSNYINCFIENGVQLLGMNGIAVCDTIVAVSMVENMPIEVIIAPNPFQTQTSIDIKTQQDYQEIEVLIFNTLGQQLRMIRSSTKKIDIERGQLSAGLYTYQILGDDKLIAIGKLVIN